MPKFTNYFNITLMKYELTMVIIDDLIPFSNRSPPKPELTSSAKVIILASCTCVNFLCIGFAVGLGVVFVQILDVFNTTRALTSLMQSLCIGVIFSGCMFLNLI